MSEPALGGIVKHPAQGEGAGTRIIAEGDGELPEDMPGMGRHRMSEKDTFPSRRPPSTPGTRTSSGSALDGANTTAQRRPRTAGDPAAAPSCPRPARRP
ncbi:hypothetical protein [Streptomyces sp. NPDC092370]|uniref:hypothetical protein n=1 Tax=Streptomyces sp. NPDC092370 TaxID=3366016 RepID=UPI003821E235